MKLDQPKWSMADSFTSASKLHVRYPSLDSSIGSTSAQEGQHKKNSKYVRKLGFEERVFLLPFQSETTHSSFIKVLKLTRSHQIHTQSVLEELHSQGGLFQGSHQGIRLISYKYCDMNTRPFFRSIQNMYHLTTRLQFTI